MAVNLAVVGLNRIGYSIGLALKNRNAEIQSVGTDLDRRTIAQNNLPEAFDKLESNLIDAVRLADVVLISLPFDHIQEAFKTIGPVLKKEAILIYFSWLPGLVSDLARQILPDHVFFIAMTPSLNPHYLEDSDQTTPHADLFANSQIFISHAPRIPETIIRFTTDLTSFLGATPYFADLAEVDGFQSISFHLSHIASAAVMLSAISEPGWRDARNLAGKEFADSTRAITSLIDDNKSGFSWIQNHDNSLRMIVDLQNSLQEIKVKIENQDEKGLQEILQNLQTERNSWIHQRHALEKEKKTNASK